MTSSKYSSKAYCDRCPTFILIVTCRKKARFLREMGTHNKTILSSDFTDHSGSSEDLGTGASVLIVSGDDLGEQEVKI